MCVCVLTVSVWLLAWLLGCCSEEGGFNPSVGALDTFWRAAENFHTTTTNHWPTATGMLWAVSQASPLRRIHVDAELSLYQYEPPYPNAGYASGGFLANSVVGGNVYPGSQQQWFTRNSELGGFIGGAFNMVFAGVKGAPSSHCGNTNGSPYTTVSTTPVIAEKPYISMDDTGLFWLNIPAVKYNSTGVDWVSNSTRRVPFSSVYVASNSTDTADTINAALSSGLHVVLTPGVYTLEAALEVTHSGQVLMGLGLATLVPGQGNAVITVANVDNVRIVGPMIVQASNMTTPVLVQWGDGTYAGNASAPGGIYDLFARVGGPDPFPVHAGTMLHIANGHVFTDNMWLWRADHTVSGIVKNSDNPVNHGLVVDGDHVTAYGLAVEHTLKDLVMWNGDFGATYFFQSELPCELLLWPCQLCCEFDRHAVVVADDVTQQNFGDRNYTSYRVASDVTSHHGFGVGVYTYFRDYYVTVHSGIVCPTSLIPNFVNPLSVYLSGHGVLQHIIDDEGTQTWYGGARIAWLCPS